MIVCECISVAKNGQNLQQFNLPKVGYCFALSRFPLGQVIILFDLSHKGLRYISLSCMYIGVSSLELLAVEIESLPLNGTHAVIFPYLSMKPNTAS